MIGGEGDVVGFEPRQDCITGSGMLLGRGFDFLGAGIEVSVVIDRFDTHSCLLFWY